jgi:hypothetical protein
VSYPLRAALLHCLLLHRPVTPCPIFRWFRLEKRVGTCYVYRVI